MIDLREQWFHKNQKEAQQIGGVDFTQHRVTTVHSDLMQAAIVMTQSHDGEWLVGVRTAYVNLDSTLPSDGSFELCGGPLPITVGTKTSFLCGHEPDGSRPLIGLMIAVGDDMSLQYLKVFGTEEQVAATYNVIVQAFKLVHRNISYGTLENLLPQPNQTIH